jgi:hypothetical protein
MNLEAIRDALHRQPFQSFNLRLADGRALYVPHPDFVAVSPRRVIHLTPEGASTFIEPLLILSIDYAAPAPNTSNGAPPQGQLPQP